MTNTAKFFLDKRRFQSQTKMVLSQYGEKLIFSFFIILSCLIVSLWFSEGKILATGEGKILFYSPQRVARIYRSVWLETGTGLLDPLDLPRLFSICFASFLDVFFPPALVEAIVFALLIATALIGAYLLMKALVGNRGVSFITALFYFFNPYTMSQVWSRFLYPGMFVWAFLPIFLLMWRLWLKDGSLKHLFWFLATSVFWITTFGHPAYPFVFFIAAGVYLVWECLLEFNLKRTRDLFFRTAVATLLFCLINAWWIYPYLTLGPSRFSVIWGPEGHFDSLKAVSPFFPLSEVVFLRQKFFFGLEGTYGEWYESLLAKTLKWTSFGLMLLGWARLRGKKSWKFLTALSLVALFLCKGANPPLGSQFYKWLFFTFPVLGMLRNPYEKVGSLLPLCFGPFFAMGVTTLGSFLGSFSRKFSQKIFYFFNFWAIIVICGLYVWPMWIGQEHFLGNIRVQVPDYYEEANRFLNQRGDFRLFHLPFQPGDGITYNWEYAYSGMETYDFLFDRASISRPLYLRDFDEIYLELPDFFNDESFVKILAVLNIGDVILHQDIDTEVRKMTSYSETKKTIEKWKDLVLDERFGKLAIYSVSPEILPGHVFATENIHFTKELDDALSLMVSSDFEPINDVVFVQSQLSKKRSAELREISKTKLSKPNVFFTKISPTQYSVKIEDASQPFFLIFSETYNPLWELSLNKEKFKHFLVNGFANGYYIDEAGDLDITLEFFPQRFLRIGVLVSAISVVFLIGLVIYFRGGRVLFS